jgi:hypothetical protein
MAKKMKLSDFSQDENNFNRHTDEGMALLGKSIAKVGVIESVTVSADDKIISGNARQEKIMAALGGDAEPIVVETDGTRPVILKRTDIKSGSKAFHEAAILANTTAKKNIELDIQLMEEVAVDDFDIDIQDLGVDVFVAPDPQAEFGKNGEFKYKNEDRTGYHQLVVHFATRDDYAAFAKVTGLSLTDKTRSTFFPQQEKELIPEAHEQ